MKSKKYRLVQMPFFAFFSKRMYHEVGCNWKGINLAYLFVLIAICCVPATLSIRNKTLKSLTANQVDFLNQIPEIQIQNGLVSINKPQPYYIKDSRGLPVAIIDTTGSMNYIDDESVKVLLTETRLIVRRGRHLYNTFNLDMVESLYLDKHAINGWVNTLRNSVAPLSYGIFLMLSYIFAVMVLLFASVAGLIIASVMHSNLSFSTALRIATVAVTPAIIFITISASAGLQIPTIVFTGITLLYLFLGIKACTINYEEATDGERVNLRALLRHDAQKKDKPAEERAA
ncbi:MAG: DUF1189 family protein [Kiritimatiellales bacterium]|nr:DUF1189 family protein [Kiritimatiellales bacterium]